MMRSVVAAWAALALAASWTSAQQSPFRDLPSSAAVQNLGLDSSYGDQRVPGAFEESIVSTLSASNQHTIFLHLLQRAKCIPMLSRIQSSTVFAPTDEAWKKWFDEHTPEEGEELYQGWLGAEGLEAWLLPREEVEGTNALDNQHWALRQHLLYHMLNYTLPVSAFISNSDQDEEAEISTQTTLLFPMAEEPALPPVPEPGSPWLPGGGQGMLGGHGQRVRIARGGKSLKEAGERGKVGVDFDGSGGVDIWDGSGWKGDSLGNVGEVKKRGKKGEKDREAQGIRWARNGAVVGVDGVLEPPPSIGEETRHGHLLCADFQTKSYRPTHPSHTSPNCSQPLHLCPHQSLRT